MFEKELQKLKRDELLEIMLAQSREIDSLTDELRKEKARSRGEEGEVAETEQNWTVDNTPDSPEDSIEEAAKELPRTADLEALVNRIRYGKRFRASVISTLMTLVVVAAAAILIAILVLPILRIYGQSMSETLDNGDIVVSVKTADLETGDIVAFYYSSA